MIKFFDIDVRFGTNQVLLGATGEIRIPGVTFLMAPNGAGKTTLIRSLLGLQPHSGSVLWDNESIDPHEQRVFPVFEDDPFYDRLTGAQNLAILAPDRRSEIRQYLTPHVLKQRVKGYSAGQRKRLSLTAALNSGAELIILDEPTNGLDTEAQRNLREDILAMSDQTGFLLTGHHLDFYGDLIDDLLVITDHAVHTVPKHPETRRHDLANTYDRYFPSAKS